MSEPIKFTSEELEKIKNIQNQYIDIQNAFGQVSLSRLRLQEQIQLLDEKDEENKQKFYDVQKNEKQSSRPHWKNVLIDVISQPQFRCHTD